MKIGQRVKIESLARPTYENDRRVWRRDGPKDLEGWYVGYTFKQEGDYQPMRYDPIDGGDQAYLSNIQSVKLLRIKLTERSNDCFAFPEDVKEVENDS